MPRYFATLFFMRTVGRVDIFRKPDDAEVIIGKPPVEGKMELYNEDEAGVAPSSLSLFTLIPSMETLRL